MCMCACACVLKIGKTRLPYLRNHTQPMELKFDTHLKVHRLSVGITVDAAVTAV